MPSAFVVQRVGRMTRAVRPDAPDFAMAWSATAVGTSAASAIHPEWLVLRCPCHFGKMTSTRSALPNANLPCSSAVDKGGSATIRSLPDRNADPPDQLRQPGIADGGTGEGAGAK